MAKVIKYIVIGSQRTGSTLIRTSLDSHQSLMCQGELFYSKYDDDASYLNYIKGYPSRRILNYLYRKKIVFDFLDTFYANESYYAVGFKFMYGQARRFPPRFPMVIDYVLKNETRVIHVARKNVLKTLLSRVTSKASNLYQTEKRTKPTILKLPTNNLISELKSIKDQDVIWSNILSDAPYLKVWYEEFVADRASIGYEMLRFLSISEKITLHSTRQKINPDTLSSILSNFDEVCDILSGTEFEYCLTE